MDQTRRERLTAGGINVAEALERLMGNETLLERFLLKFLADTNYPGLCAAIETGDRAAALETSHALKGLCGNLSMTGLYDLFNQQVAALRRGDWDCAVGLMAEISAGHDAVAAAIRGE